jgi:hypothetical protein
LPPLGGGGGASLSCAVTVFFCGPLGASTPHAINAAQRASHKRNISIRFIEDSFPGSFCPLGLQIMLVLVRTTKFLHFFPLSRAARQNLEKILRKIKGFLSSGD